MKRNNRNFMTYDKNSVFASTRIIDIKEHNKECSNGSFKNVFTAMLNGEEKTCVLWERSCMEKGDLIDMKGIFKDNIFICYSAMVRKNGNFSDTKRGRNVENVAKRCYSRKVWHAVGRAA